MNVIRFVFQKVFPFWFLTPQQAEEREEARVRTVLIAMFSLDLERVTFPHLDEIQAMLMENGSRMRRRELVDVVERCVRMGYMQKLGGAGFQYVLSPDGRNRLGLPGDRDG